MARTIDERLTRYLADAHSIEEQALEQLRWAPDMAGDAEFARILREHARETEDHERRIRVLLEERAAGPSRVKDAVMRAGGTGMVLFARAQVDTPGKLAAHALSYEAFEWASYDMLARAADRAGQSRVADAARSIREEERAMMGRIESVLQRTADASLERVGRDDLRKQLRKYLADAHAIEAQSIQLLESGADRVSEPTLSRLFREHLEESRVQQEALEERLDALGGKRSLLKDAALRIGAFQWSTFFGLQPDTDGKLAVFAYAFEYLEIGGYEQLRRVADRAGDEATVAAAERIAAEERAAAERLSGAFEGALSSALGAHVG